MSTVLLVDDEKNVLKTLSLSLRRYDFSVRQAQSGPDALAELERAPCDFLVSDIRMAPMDGYRLASIVHDKFPGMPIIFMSAYGTEDPSLSEELSLLPRLTKPFPVTDLVRLLKERDGDSAGPEPCPGGDCVRILLFETEGRGRGVADRLREMGFHADLAKPDPDGPLPEGLGGYDLVALDERVLEGRQWVLLNRIDQALPDRPVLLISDRRPETGPPGRGSGSLAVLPRRAIFEHAGRSREFILEHVRPR
jgi:CheY-like chemotaxis protein